MRVMPMFLWGKKHEALKRAEALLSECCQRLDLAPKSIGKSGREWIARRQWGEDSSEMRRMIYAAALAANGESIEAAHFPPRCRQDHEASAKAQFETLALEEVVRHKVAHFFHRLGKVEAAGVRDAVMTQVERPLVEECLRWAKGNQLKAARVLGIDRNTLQKKMKQLGVSREDLRPVCDR